MKDFKTFLSESNAEEFRKKFDTIVNSPEFKRLSASQSIGRDNPTENPWQLTGHNSDVGVKGTSPEIEAMKEKVFGKRQGNSHLWWYHQDHGLITHPAIGDLTHRDVESASEWDLKRNNADVSVVKKIAPEKPGIIDSIRTYFGSAPEVPAWITAKNKILAKGRIENHEGGGGLISYTPGEEVETTGLNQSRRSVDSGIVRTLSRKFSKHQIHDGRGNLIENTKHKKILSETIRKTGDDYTIYSKKGKSLGKYDSKNAAVKRLKQIEWFKRHRSY